MPQDSEKWQDIMEDLNKYIMPGMTHWQSPNFHAFYPSQTSYPAIIGEMISAGLGNLINRKKNNFLQVSKFHEYLFLICFIFVAINQASLDLAG